MAKTFTPLNETEAIEATPASRLKRGDEMNFNGKPYVVVNLTGKWLHIKSKDGTKEVRLDITKG